MNNAQLDMVLDYLNEGTEIDSSDYMMESLNEMIQTSIYESTMITSLLEEDEAPAENEEEPKDDKAKKPGIGSKIKQAIVRFIEWVKTLITKLKAQMAKLAIKAMIPRIKKNVENQKKALANSNTKIKLSDFEYAVIYEDELTNMINDGKYNSEFANNTKINNNFRSEFSKVPKFIVLLLPNIAKDKANVKAPNANKEISASEFVSKLSGFPEKANNCVQLIDSSLKFYNDGIAEAKKLYKENPEEANKAIKEATKIMNTNTKIATGSIKALLVMLHLTNRSFNKATK